MSKGRVLLISLTTIGVLGIIFNYLLNGDPGSCGKVSKEEINVLRTLNQVNRLIADEIDRIEMSDEALTAVLRERLDPKVNNFQICFLNNRVAMSGQTTNRLGITVKFKGQARFQFSGNSLKISELEVWVGRLKLPKQTEKMINARLEAFNFGKQFTLKVQQNLVIIENVR